jgi:hypothetical protein
MTSTKYIGYLETCSTQKLHQAVFNAMHCYILIVGVSAPESFVLRTS